MSINPLTPDRQPIQTKIATEEIHNDAEIMTEHGPELLAAPEIVDEHRPSVKQLVKAENETFVTLVANGVSVNDAAAAVGVKPTTIVRREDVRKALEETMQFYIADPAARKAYIQARATQIAVTATKDADAINALKVLTLDPAVEMGAGRDAPNLVINIGEAGKVFERLPEMPEFDEEKK